MSASLQGTLQGDQAITPEQAAILAQYQALAQQQAQQLSQNTQQAQQGATQAAEQYQQAAAQPPPNPYDLGAFLTMLGGNTASILGGTPSYRENAQQRVQQSRAEQLKARADNLQALQDVAAQKAAEAKRAGDLETEHKFRSQFETLGKQLDLVNANAQRAASDERQNKMFAEQEKLQNMRDAAAAARQANKAKAGAVTVGGQEIDPTDYVIARDTPEGEKRGVVDLSQVKQAKVKDYLTNYAKQNGLAVWDQRETNADQLLNTVEQDMQDVKDRIIPLLPNVSGKGLIGGALERGAKGAENKAKAFFQTPGEGEALAGYPAIRTGAIKTIQALAVLGKGLRINQAEINAAMNFDYPRIDDSQGTANEKFRILGMMAKHIRQALLGQTPDPKEVADVIRSSRAIKAGQAPPARASAPTQAQATPAQAIKPVGRLVKMIDRNGKPRTIDAAEVQDAINKGGWKRAPVQ